MAREFTPEQMKAITEKGSNILVAAAAGSGKTTVLVERIIRKIVDEKIDIDRLLIVTFTNAAAAEMRERILEALYKKIDEDPDNKWLSKQVMLLSKASICTIDSFCLDVIKNNFFEIDISPNFRIADNVELDILKQEVLDDVFEKLYESKEIFFEKLVKIYTGYHGDDSLKELVLKIYHFIQSNPFPEEWLKEKVEEYNVKDRLDDGFENTVWGKILIENAKEELIDEINSLKVIRNKIERFEELEKYTLTITQDINGLDTILKSMSSWDRAFECVTNFKFKSWPINKKVVMQLKDEARAARDNVKDKYKKMVNKTFLCDSKDAMRDIFDMYEIMSGLEKLVLLFIESFKKKKQDKNIMDFSDIEHYALNILLNKNENGEYVESDVAKRYQYKFKEIAIDEYQDSNLVQEYLLKSVSNGKNIFMVGDVKQSIYKFRQAVPELFLEKYEKYGDEGNDLGIKIKLFKNFRSRNEVLDFSNLVFESVMSKKLGDIDYTEEEYLNPTAKFGELEGRSQDYKTIINVIDLKKDDDFEDDDQLEKTEIEAKFVAKEIKKLIDSKFQVYGKDGEYRDIQYKDIAILLRTTANTASVFEKELYNLEVPVYSDSSSEYLNSIEIQTIISFLKVIDNPTDDISLVTVLRSPIGNFDDNELVEIRIVEKQGCYYDALTKALTDDNISDELREKVKVFLDRVESLRTEEEYLSLDEFIWKIYEDTDYLNYVKLMPNGDLREANLRMLFERAKSYEKVSFKGLYNFIRYIERIKSFDGDLSAAKIIGENENVVRIMSIHKSKGLEFPVVFLSRTDKSFNLRDLNEPILMHSSLGIGLKYINYERKIEYDTAAKQAIKLRVKDEFVSEEMRILYVALTRAKERLFITGISNDFEKDISNKKELLKVYDSDGKKINHLLVKKYLSYLDWLEIVYLYCDGRFMELNQIKRNDLKFDEENFLKKEKIEISEGTDISKVQDILGWKYKFENVTKIPSKLSVSKIKELRTDKKFENDELKKPEFMKDKKITRAQIGTLIHLVLQNLDFNINYDMTGLQKFVDSLVLNNKITKEERKVIDLNIIYNFTRSNLAKKLRNAKVVEREKPFYTRVSAKDIYGIDSDEMILVQGIMDLYFIDSDDMLYLVDYKTDFVRSGREIIDRYDVQLDIYRKALENALERKVDRVIIYSTHLGKEIEVK